MRKQYHLRQGKNGLDAWDVDRLVDLSRDLSPFDIPLSSIREVDTVYWFDDSEPPTVRSVIEHVRLIQAVDLSYPIILGADGRVMDGMHRIARAILEGHETITAVQLTSDLEPDFTGCRPDELPY
jgi:hypothetical protein